MTKEEREALISIRKYAEAIRERLIGISLENIIISREIAKSIVIKSNNLLNGAKNETSKKETKPLRKKNPRALQGKLRRASRNI